MELGRGIYKGSAEVARGIQLRVERHASTVRLTKLINTERDGEEMTSVETPAKMYAKSMRWMDEMLADTLVDKEVAPAVSKETARSAPAEVADNSDDVV